MNAREQRGLVIAALHKLRFDNGKWVVPSQSGNGKKYLVSLEQQVCTCPDCQDTGFKCKHIFAVEFMLKREHNSDGTVTETQTMTVNKKITYPQDWPAYNKAQTEEKKLFQILLADLCKDINEPVRKGVGRTPTSAQDAVFACVFKVYTTLSTRRFTTDLKEAHVKGYVTKPIHYNSVCAYFENKLFTPIFHDLIVRSSLPLKKVDVDFASDSSGFTTSRFVNWRDHKNGVTRKHHDWVKVHLMCGVKTNVVTAVEIHERNAADSPLFPSLITTTRKNFTINEVSADKGYLSQQNIEAAFDAGAVPFIPFKTNSTEGAGGLWEKMFHYFQLNQEEFLKHYHKRSNVESTFAMIKAKFGDHIRSRSDVAKKNEALAKIVCHNVCCVIQAMFELGIQPTFLPPGGGGKAA